MNENEEMMESMHIVKLTAQNVLNLVAVELELKTGAVILSGKNGAGKSNVLRAIEFALDGKALRKTTEPVRHGEESGKVILDLGELIVTRSFTNERASLQITNKEGMVFKSPQAMLDKFKGNISFDPLEFSTLPKKQQKEVLLGLINLSVNLDELAANRKELFEQRTLFNRQTKALEAQRNALNPYPTLPDGEISTTDIMNQYHSAIAEIAEDDKDLQTVKQIDINIEANRTRIQNLQSQMEQLSKGVMDLTSQKSEIVSRSANRKLPDLDLFKLKLNEVEGTNEKIREKIKCKDLSDQIDSMKDKSNQATTEIDAIDSSKTKAIEEAQMPVFGLGFDETGVTFGSTPLSQCCSSEKIKISVAIGMALNPELKVLWISDASLLDEESMEEVKLMALEHGYQLFLEVVDESGTMGIVIEDGTVVAVNQDNKS